MPDSLGRDKRSENTRNARGLCFMKECKNKPKFEITMFGIKRMVCAKHKDNDGVR